MAVKEFMSALHCVFNGCLPVLRLKTFKRRGPGQSGQGPLVNDGHAWGRARSIFFLSLLPASRITENCTLYQPEAEVAPRNPLTCPAACAVRFLRLPSSSGQGDRPLTRGPHLHPDGLPPPGRFLYQPSPTSLEGCPPTHPPPLPQPLEGGGYQKLCETLAIS